MTTQSSTRRHAASARRDPTQAGESRESRSAGAMIRWPRDLTDLGRLAAFRGHELAVRDIKVEEFVDGEQLVVKAEIPRVDPENDIDVSVDNGVLTIAAERQEAIARSSTRNFHSEFT